MPSQMDPSARRARRFATLPVALPSAIASRYREANTCWVVNIGPLPT